MVPRFKNLATQGFAIALTKLSSRLVASSATMYRVHFTTAPEKKVYCLALEATSENASSELSGLQYKKAF